MAFDVVFVRNELGNGKSPHQENKLGVDRHENVTAGAPWENGPLGIQVTSRHTNFSRAQQRPQDAFILLMSGLGRVQCQGDRLKCTLCPQLLIAILNLN